MDEESCKVENANEVGETISNPSEIESQDCSDTNWKDAPDLSKYVGKYVVIKYDKKPYQRVVEDTGGREIYVQCMHRVDKKDNNWVFFGLEQSKTSVCMSLMMYNQLSRNQQKRGIIFTLQN